MKKTKVRCKPLQKTHRTFIATEIARLLPVAGDESNPMRKVARDLVDRLIWRWTADGYDPKTNAVLYDARKYDCDAYAHTPAARKRARAGKRGIRHEHVIPKRALIERLLRERPDAQATRRFLDRFCIVAIVLKEDEERYIPKALRKSMPTTFSFDDPSADLWARYRPHSRAAKGLFARLRFPKGPRR